MMGISARVAAVMTLVASMTEALRAPLGGLLLRPLEDSVQEPDDVDVQTTICGQGKGDPPRGFRKLFGGSNKPEERSSDEPSTSRVGSRIAQMVGRIRQLRRTTRALPVPQNMPARPSEDNVYESPPVAPSEENVYEPAPVVPSEENVYEPAPVLPSAENLYEPAPVVTSNEHIYEAAPELPSSEHLYEVVQGVSPAHNANGPGGSSTATLERIRRRPPMRLPSGESIQSSPLRSSTASYTSIDNGLYGRTPAELSRGGRTSGGRLRRSFSISNGYVKRCDRLVFGNRTPSMEGPASRSNSLDSRLYGSLQSAKRGAAAARASRRNSVDSGLYGRLRPGAKKATTRRARFPSRTYSSSTGTGSIASGTHHYESLTSLAPGAATAVGSRRLSRSVGSSIGSGIYSTPVDAEPDTAAAGMAARRSTGSTTSGIYSTPLDAVAAVRPGRTGPAPVPSRSAAALYRGGLPSSPPNEKYGVFLAANQSGMLYETGRAMVQTTLQNRPLPRRPDSIGYVPAEAGAGATLNNRPSRSPAQGLQVVPVARTSGASSALPNSPEAQGEAAAVTSRPPSLPPRNRRPRASTGAIPKRPQ